MHYEPLRPNRTTAAPERYEFTHGERSVCVYDIHTLEFIKEIPVGEFPDCHATSLDNRYLYIASFEGIHVIDQESLEVVKVIDTGKVYATNALPDGNTLLVHDVCGGVILLRDICDMERIHIHSRTQVIPDGKFRCEIGGKGNFYDGGKYYLCAGWRQKKVYRFDTEKGFAPEIFLDSDDRLDGGDDLVMNADRTKAYIACADRNRGRCHVAVVDIPGRKLIGCIPTGFGTCGMTMTGDERYAVVSNDRDNSISVIDTQTDRVVNTPDAGAGFRALGITGCIQGISCGKDDSVYVYGCDGNGALIRFFDITKSNKYIISNKGTFYYSEPKENYRL